MQIETMSNGPHAASLWAGAPVQGMSQDWQSTTDLSEREKGTQSSAIPVARPGVSKSLRYQSLGKRLLKAGLMFASFWILWYRYSGARHDRDVGPIQWEPCFDAPHALCGTFSVPTDHENPQDGTTILSLAKIPYMSPNASRLGSVYTNPGGPGASGRQFCLEHGTEIRDLVGGRFDIICWDQRGIGRTLPRVNCWGSASEQAKVLRNTVLERTFEVPLDPSTPSSRDLMEFQQTQALNLMELQATACEETMGSESLKWMGTTTFIKDLVALKDAIDRPEAFINFHGGSYGAIVADYLVNMLPDKVGAVIAHGTVDAEVWAGSHYETYDLLTNLLTHSDITLETFIMEYFCFAHSSTSTSSEDDCVEEHFRLIESLLDSLRQSGQSVSNGTTRGIFTSGMLRSVIFNSLQTPQSAKSLAEAIGPVLGSEHPDFLPLYHLWRTFAKQDADTSHADGFVSVGQSDLARLAVSCADQPPYARDEHRPTPSELVNNLLRGPMKASRLFGATVHLMEQHGGCQFWPQSSKPVERFTGPWNATLRQRMLVVSNTDDPVTPAKSGRQVAKRQGSAHHLIQPGLGHSYFVKPSKCYREVAKRYFETGWLPEGDETVCDE